MAPAPCTNISFQQSRCQPPPPLLYYSVSHLRPQSPVVRTIAYLLKHNSALGKGREVPIFMHGEVLFLDYRHQRSQNRKGVACTSVDVESLPVPRCLSTPWHPLGLRTNLAGGIIVFGTPCKIFRPPFYPRFFGPHCTGIRLQAGRYSRLCLSSKVRSLSPVVPKASSSSPPSTL